MIWGFRVDGQKCMSILRAAAFRQGLMLLPSNRFEALGRDRKEHFSSCIKQQWRICFDWPEKSQVYHIHSGTFLADELQELNMSAAELTWQLHVLSNRIYQLISGKRAMTADTALRLEQWLGVEAAFWMNLQNRNERDLASDRTGGKIKLTDHCRSSPSSVQAFEP